MVRTRWPEDSGNGFPSMIRTTGPNGAFVPGVVEDSVFRSLVGGLVEYVTESLSLSLPNRGPGRPSKYHPGLCEVVPLLMSRGMSRYEVALELGICYETLLNWEDQHVEFFNALKKGTDWSRAWWERQSRTSLRLGHGEKFETGPWLVNMINKFGWKSANSQVKEEKSGKFEFEHKTKIEKTINIDVSGLSDEKVSELLVLLSQAKTPEGKPIAAEPVRDTLH